MVTSIMPVIEELGIKQDIAFNGMLKVNMNNTMITLKPKHIIRTRITVGNGETIELGDGCEMLHLASDLLEIPP